MATDSDDRNKRKAIIAHCLQMNRLGINQGNSGNISVRHGDGLLITPTSMPYDRLTPEDIVSLSSEGVPEGRREPSSEWRLHHEVMRHRPEFDAVVHAHPPYCTTLAIMGLGIPAIHYMIAVAGGADIRCAPYAIFGSEALAKNAVAALTDRKACLLAHHGMIVAGSSLEQAMWLAVEVETLARQYHGCLQLGTPTLLDERQIEAVIARMDGYGHRA